MYLRIYCATD